MSTQTPALEQPDHTTLMSIEFIERLEDALTDSGTNDPDYGEPQDWPTWTDEYLWTSEFDQQEKYNFNE